MLLGYYAKKILLNYPKALLTAFGFVWLIIEPTTTLLVKIDLSYWQLWFLAGIVGIPYLIYDGIAVSGYFRKSVTIKSNMADTTISIAFGDFFKMKGFKAVGVNDFFDSLVDNRHISQKSLHGLMLLTYWNDNTLIWDEQVSKSLKGLEAKHENRLTGKNLRYPIGATAHTVAKSENFLCTAISHTDIDTLETRSTSIDIQLAMRNLLAKARSVCANETLNIPLIGSGLSRVGVKSNILLELILLSIFQETKIKKITSKIQIILPVDRVDEFNLLTIKNNWS